VPGLSTLSRAQIKEFVREVVEAIGSTGDERATAVVLRHVR
jgi:hypothetical protein